MDNVSLGSVLDVERVALMSRAASCKPNIGLTVGLGSGERLTPKYPVLGL